MAELLTRVDCKHIYLNVYLLMALVLSGKGRKSFLGCAFTKEEKTPLPFTSHVLLARSIKTSDCHIDYLFFDPLIYLSDRSIIIAQY